MFQISEVQESPAFNGGRSFLTLRVQENYADASAPVVQLGQNLRLEGGIALVILVMVVLGMGWLVFKR